MPDRRSMTVHPLFSVLARRPDLVLDHLDAYAALASAQARSAGAALARRAIAAAVAVCAFLVFLVLAGVAIMLGALQAQFHWMLVLVPGVMLGLALAAFLQARRGLPRGMFMALRAQVQADIETLRTLGAA